MSSDTPDFPDQSPAALAASQAQVGALNAQRDALSQNNNMMSLLTPKLLGALGITQTKSGFELADRGSLNTSKKIQRMVQSREISALKGKLPVNSQLSQQLDRQEQELKAQLAASLGPDYAATSSGQQALADFRQRKANIIDNSARQDITSLAGVSAGKQQSIDQIIQTALGVQQAPLAGINLFSNNATGFGGIVNADNRLRSGQFEADLQSQDSFFGGIGSLVGTIGGAAIGGPFGASVGSSIGGGISNLFGGDRYTGGEGFSNFDALGLA